MRIAEAAIELMDRDGIDGLSMRKLGADLGVEAMSLYHYVENKDDLLNAVMVLLYNEVEIPELDDPAEWRTVVRSALGSFYKVLRAHPAAPTLFSTRPADFPEAFITLHAGFRLFRTLGLEPDEAYVGLNFAVSYVMGHASEAYRGAEQRLFDVGPPELLTDPLVQDFVQAGRAYDADELFDLGVDLVIIGLSNRFGLD